MADANWPPPLHVLWRTDLHGNLAHNTFSWTPGSTSFEDRHDRDTFQEAAVRLGVCADVDEWVLCKQEAVAYQSPAFLRNLFVTPLVFNTVAEPCRFGRLS